MLGALLPHWVNFVIYQVLLEAKASEHSARMVAMKNATDNANKLIDDLTLDTTSSGKCSLPTSCSILPAPRWP